MPDDPTQTNSPPTPLDEPSPDALRRVKRAEDIIRKFVLLSLGAGAIPVPIFDIVASIGLQLKLIQELSDLYDMDHRDDLARNAIGTLMTTTAGLMLGSHINIGASMAKFLPGIGTKIGIVKTAVFFGASTHISGKILIMHFESGGTLLDLNPPAMREHLRKEFSNSERYVYEIHDELRRAAPAPA